LQHAYAVTTYSAQGTTVDRAFVAADPSMDKQELYVAASRSRGETMIFATPEVQVGREEFAPADRYIREGIPHIAEASERDRAQRAAHDEALRAALRGLPTGELRARREGLVAGASEEKTVEGRRGSAEAWLQRQEENRDHAVRQREAAEAASRKVRREALPEAQAREESCRQRVEGLRAELAGMPPVRHEARSEPANVDLVLSERHRIAITAVQLAPPEYVVRELGERPSDPVQREPWDRGVAVIEGYRQEYGVTDRRDALGKEPRHAIERSHWQEQRTRLAEQQRALQRQQGHAIELDIDHGMDMGL
jgi:hypothetical protein